MTIRAVIFDIYGTLLEVGPPPPDAPTRWDLLWQDRLKTKPRLSLEQFNEQCGQVITREHAAARDVGIEYPEIYWPAVVSEVLPEFAHLSEAERSEFRFYQAQMSHTVRLMPDAAPVLRFLSKSGVRLGLASNSQPYTLRELDMALAGAKLARDIFARSLNFFSFEHGFSKPDPHVFRILTARLEARGIRPPEILMVGDHLDQDIEPARAQGWQTWHLTPQETNPNAGDWPALHRWLRTLS